LFSNFYVGGHERQLPQKRPWFTVLFQKPYKKSRLFPWEQLVNFSYTIYTQ
jgi:hypothetical protein